jgi:CSLREA domain-containing protein
MIRRESTMAMHGIAKGSMCATVLLASVLLPARHAFADITYNVNTTADLVDDNVNDGGCHTSANTCSLRAAIMQANHLNETIFINLPAGVFVLTLPPAGMDGDDSGDLNLTASASVGPAIFIMGAGAAQTIIDGNHAEGVFMVHTGRSAVISSVTLRNGLRDNGGAVSSGGYLTLFESIIENNHARFYGGGVYNDFGTLYIIRSTVRANVADEAGGGVFEYGTTHIQDSTISNNAADLGGGLHNGNGRTSAVNSTISYNVATTDGGGIYSNAETSIYNTTIIGNDADHDRDEGGGIGGGIYNRSPAQFIVVNSLIAANTIVDSPIYNDCSGAFEVYGRNLFYDAVGCTFTGNGDLGWAHVALGSIGPLQGNGGPTLTHALLAGSEAIDTSVDALGCVDEYGVDLAYDQRGAPRIAGARCDVGAFEFGSVAATDAIFRNGFDGGP